MIPPVCYRRPAISRPSPGPVLVSAPTPAPIATPNNNLFQKFIQSFMEKAQALVFLAASSPDTEAKNDINRPLKLRNPDLYYGSLHMEWYYFCQQCRDYFEVVRSLGYKRISFAIGFLKDHTLN